MTGRGMPSQFEPRRLRVAGIRLSARARCGSNHRYRARRMNAVCSLVPLDLETILASVGNTSLGRGAQSHGVLRFWRRYERRFRRALT